MEAARHDKRTVFVRGVAFSTGPDDFEAHFSELGPVRTSFLVKDKGQTGHKGFGFVQYALPEDAQKAAEQLHNTEFQGRKLKVEPAVKRAPLNDRKKRKLGDVDSSAQPGAEAANANDSVSKPMPAAASLASNAPTAVQPKPPAAKTPPKVSARASKKARKQREGIKPAPNPKQRLVRTVALGNLQPGSKEEALAMAQAAGKVESVEDPPSELDMSHARLKQDGCTGLVVFVVYDSVKAALGAVATLHAQPLGKQLQKSAKRQKVGAAEKASEQLWARQVSGEGLHLKKWRLIIRNLAFQAKPTDLKAALEAGGGFVWELSLPKNAEGSLKGFGFATFMTRGHAESAIKNTNGKVVAGRQVVVDWAMAKARFMDASAQPSDKQEEAGAPRPADTLPVDDNAPDLEDAAVLAQQGQDTADVIDPATEQKMVQSVLDALLRDEEAHEPKGDLAAAPAATPAADTAQQQTAAAKPSQAEAANKAQPSKFAKSIQDMDTGGGVQQAGARDSSKTVFVRALPADASQDQLHLAFTKFGKLRSCRLVMNKETQQPKGTAFVEYWDTTAAQAAAAACQKAREGGAGGIMVGGRTVEVDLALSQDDARNLASGGRALSGPGKDNRNLYLAKEGTIEEGSAAWDSMSATDRSKRKRAAEEKNTKLRSPNFSVSRTRLSVRNIPFTLQEKELKQLFIAAVKEHASKAQPRVKQAKILRDPERIEPADGLPRSRGLGFVEFTEHEHAICALRHLNNNPAPFSRDKRPIVEFALESAQAVRKMATKQAWQKTQVQGKAGAGQQVKQSHEGPIAAGAQPVPAAQKTGSKASKERKPAKKRPGTQESSEQIKNKKAKGTAEPNVAQVKPASLQQCPAKEARVRPKHSAKQDDGPNKQSVERKRHADAALDQLAARAAPSASGAQQRGKLSKGGQAKGEKGDKLDDMISSYKAKYFGAQMQAAPATQHAKKPAAGISRWFE